MIYYCLFIGVLWFGVNIMKEDICDNFEGFVWELVVVKINVIIVVSEVTCFIFSVDEIIKNFKFGGDVFGGLGMGRGRGRFM